MDGATWEILDYFIDQDIMPNLKKLKKESCYGNLKSTILPITPSAWASMMTGCTPAKTGIFHFSKVSENNTYTKIIVNGADIKVPTMWEVLSSYGKDIISINVPMTFPPRPVNGIVITGMMTPSEEEKYTYPEDLVDELKANGINYKIDTSLHRQRDKSQDESIKQLSVNGAEIFFKELNALFDIRKRTIWYLLENKKWQYFMFVIIGIDRIQHHLWNHIKNPELDPETNKNIIKYYRQVDEFVGELCSKYRKVGNIFIVSDHGFAKFHGDFMIENWLMEKGYLNIKEIKVGNWKTMSKNMLKKYGIDVRKIADYFLSKEKINKLQLSASNFDWAHTIAYAPSINGVNINLKGRETLGCVEPEQYNKVRDKLISELKNITNHDGIKIVKDTFKKEKVYGEGRLDHIPDIILEFNDHLLYRSMPSPYITKNIELFKTYNWLTGNHIRNGIFLAIGRDINNGKIINDLNIEDIFPTLIALNDEKIPDYIDGKIAKDIIRRDIEETYISFDYNNKKKKYDYSEDSEKDLKEKLESLGYM